MQDVNYIIHSLISYNYIILLKPEVQGLHYIVKHLLHSRLINPFAVFRVFKPVYTIQGCLNLQCHVNLVCVITPTTSRGRHMFLTAGFKQDVSFDMS